MPLHIIYRLQLLKHFILLSSNWLTVLIFIYAKKIDLICKLRNGTKFFVQHPSNLEAIVENWAPKWRYSYFGNHKEIIPKNSIIDIGAHIGTFSIFMGRKYPNLEIFSYEPDHHNFKLFKKNIEINSQTNIRAFNLAITDKKRTVNLYPKKGRGFGTMGSNIISTGSKYNAIQAISLLDILEENKIDACDLLKMDCEGAEYEILLNQNSCCFNKINNIIMEYHLLPDLNNTPDEIVLHLTNHGYNVKSFPRNKNSGFIIATK